MIEFINTYIGSDVKADVLLKYDESLKIDEYKNISSPNKLFKQEINICIDKNIDNIEQSIGRACGLLLKYLNKTIIYKSVLIDLNSFTNEDTNITYIASVFIEKFKELDTLKHKYEIYLPLFNKKTIPLNCVYKKSLNHSNDFNEENDCSKSDSNVLQSIQNQKLSFSYDSNSSNILNNDELKTYVSAKVRNYKRNSFTVVLFNMIEDRLQKGIVKKKTDIYPDSGITADLFSKMMNGKKGVTRKDVAGLAIALRLNIKEAEDFYHLAGFHLTDLDLFDVAIRLSIKAGLTNSHLVNDYIDDMNKYLTMEHIKPIQYLGAISEGSRDKKEK